MSDPINLSVDALRARGVTPKWFGLGFIQMKLDDHQRLHFWHPELSADTPEEELHDHRYEFRSQIVRGSMTHETFDFVEDADGDYEMVEVSCKPGVEADPRPISRGRAIKSGSYTLVAGSSYIFPHTGFHRIVAERVVTLLTRGPVVKDHARVIKPIGVPTVCPFSREIAEDRLWECIADLLEGTNPRPGYHLRPIEKGVLGEASKIVEETAEFADAVEQGVSVMALVELSDLHGAIDTYLARHHPSVGMHDLAEMSRITRRAFENGRR